VTTVKPKRTQRSIPEEDGIPFEFRGETKLVSVVFSFSCFYRMRRVSFSYPSLSLVPYFPQRIIDMVLALRNKVQLQNQKIEDLEDYIDGRLAEVMAKIPAALEIEN